ncbi:hypothetical protein JOB18_042182 [Solea senegalensis]|uniref:Secreted protein n=1 Tax=Solea senegalensis TaxID=28829 RepID=A0AAV6QEM2_SOLSE|nr:hypothetical protein JOB18_042182 [Solea senegalensis]
MVLWRFSWVQSCIRKVFCAEAAVCFPGRGVSFIIPFLFGVQWTCLPLFTCCLMGKMVNCLSISASNYQRSEVSCQGTDLRCCSSSQEIHACPIFYTEATHKMQKTSHRKR